jgi:hypothetical protein
MQNIVIFKEPKFKPMPGELTPAVINGATLPVKIGIAQRAIAACCDLSELLTWKDKLAALAAAAKMAKMPEMARDVNRVHKEAILRMGELLLQYSGAAVRGTKLPADIIRVARSDKYSVKEASAKTGLGISHVYELRKNPNLSAVQASKSDRVMAATHAGIPIHLAYGATKLASAPKKLQQRILADDKIPCHVQRMARSLPSRHKNNGNPGYSNAGSLFFQAKTIEQLKYMSSNVGATHAARALRAVDVSVIPQLTPEEKQRAKKLIVEMQEILDEMDRRLGS